jgi:hypothetical protein
LHDGQRADGGRGASLLRDSTSRGTFVAKLDDVTIHERRARRRRGCADCVPLRERGITRTTLVIATTRAWRFYERLGFQPLDEERISLLIA